MLTYRFTACFGVSVLGRRTDFVDGFTAFLLGCGRSCSNEDPEGVRMCLDGSGFSD